MTTTEPKIEDRVAQVRHARKVMRQEREHAEATMPKPDCLCTDSFSHLSAEDHDRILNVESDGIRGIVQLIEEMVCRQESCRNPGELCWWELHNFIEMHSWQDAVAMYRFGSILNHLQNAYRERDVLKHPEWDHSFD